MTAEKDHSVGCVIWRDKGDWRVCVCSRDDSMFPDTPAERSNP